MTSTQRLQLEQSANRQKIKLNALLGVEPDDADLTNREPKSMICAHETAANRSDGELRAAIHAEGDDEARALAAHGADGADGESAERRRLLDGVTLGFDYLASSSCRNRA